MFQIPEIAMHTAVAGHESGNHTDTHPALLCKSPRFLFDELRRAQDAISEVTGIAPRLFERRTESGGWASGSAAKARTVTRDVDDHRKRLEAECKPGSGSLMRGSRNGCDLLLHDARDRGPIRI